MHGRSYATSEKITEIIEREIFVIMPFSSTASCTEDQWLEIFENVFKPAAESCGYTCRRAMPSTGSLIKSIVHNLRTSHVVLADLTDRNPNVFYELGVRHALSKRTIIVSQKEGDIPSDLKGYWCLVYGTSPGQVSKYRNDIARILSEIEQRPEYSDNPVSDYLDHERIDIDRFMAKESVKKLGALITELTANINTLKELQRDPMYREYISTDCLSLLLNTLYVDPGSCVLSNCYELRHNLTGIRLGHRLDAAFIAVCCEAANNVLKSAIEIRSRISVGQFHEPSSVSTLIWKPTIERAKQDVTAYSHMVGLANITEEEIRRQLQQPEKS